MARWKFGFFIILFYISEAATDASFNLLTIKSKVHYERQFEIFIKWCETKEFTEYSESVLLTYFKDKAKTIKACTLWPVYSMLRATLNAKISLDISKYKKLTTYIKEQTHGYQRSQSKGFSRGDIEKFLIEAPDDRFLMIKVSLNTDSTYIITREQI